MEGVTYETASFAGANNLGKLIVLYDSNETSLDGKINKTSDKLNKGIINVSFEVIGPLYAEIYAKYKNVVLKYEFEVVYDDDSFTALYALINKTAPNGILNLTQNYRFYYYDADYIEGIPIDKAITINGNGFNVNFIVLELGLFSISTFSTYHTFSV